MNRADGYEAMTALAYEIVSSHGVLPGVLNVNKGVTLAHTALGGAPGQTDPDECFFWGRYAVRRFPGVVFDLEGGNPCPVRITEVPLVDASGTITWTPRLLDTRRNSSGGPRRSCTTRCSTSLRPAVCAISTSTVCRWAASLKPLSRGRMAKTFPVTTMRVVEQKNRTARFQPHGRSTAE